MKKLVTFLMMILLLNLFAAAGLAGYLVATGRLDKPKAVVIADLLRHQGTPKDLRTQVTDILEPAPATAPATGPASRPAGSLADAGPATAEERIDFARQAMEQERLRLDAERQNLRHEHELLERMQAKIDADRKRVDEDKKNFEQSVTQTAAKTNDEAFTRTMALYAELKPKQLKDLFLPMPQDEVAKYLKAMDPERAAKIITEFKSEPEKSYINAVLKRLRETGTDSASAPLTTPAATDAPASPAPASATASNAKGAVAP
jgi:flagellar motility protein MotE (MotC chaperone)